jgi:cyclophilin family peptidyl-prolyl cis-trans isomerase/HEAT repeat protein
MSPKRLALVALFVVIPAAQGPDRAAVRQAMLVAEDARAPSAAAVQTLVDAARGPDEENAVAAVRALGRLERASLVAELTAFLNATAWRVRLEAANALGQAVSSSTGDVVERARRALAGRLPAERELHVRGAICEALGRLPYASADQVRAAEATLVEATFDPAARARMQPSTGSTALGSPVMGVTIGLDRQDRSAPLPVLLGATKGLEALVRQQAKRSAPQAPTLDRLRRIARTARAPAESGVEPSEIDLEMHARVRRLAFLALNQVNAADESTIAAGLDDDDAQVRRLAALVAGETAGLALERREKLIAGGRLTDEAPMVRLSILRAFAALRPKARDCAPIMSAAGDLDLHVSLAAIDLLGPECADAGPALDVLARHVGGLPEVPPDRWHAAAHALVSLARLSSERASVALPSFAEHPRWQVRMYAARAAGTIADAATLERLAGDTHPNVREAALGALVALKGHDADPFAIDALGSQDYQLVRTAARALAGDKGGGSFSGRSGKLPPPLATAALIGALARITMERRDTSRDPRLAILEALRETGSAETAPALEPYLKDFDPRVAAAAAAVLSAWTGRPREPVTKAPAAQPAPSWTDAWGLASARVIFLMRRGGAFELALYPSEAPATVARFARLAREGYYDGLTFHRVVPNFVIQGGSPGANEYVGADPYMRDEVSLRSHTRGTVGISTRGRDTGDAQIFINLVDNPRLDHQYTAFAEVVRGMDVVDHIVEGDVIERVEIVVPSQK